MRAALAFGVLMALAYADAARTRLHGCPVVTRMTRRKPPTAADLDLEALGRAHYEDACEAFCNGASHS